MKKKLLEILGENGENWSEVGYHAVDSNGEATRFDSPTAVKWSLLGAILKTRPKRLGEACDYIHRNLDLRGFKDLCIKDFGEATTWPIMKQFIENLV